MSTRRAPGEQEIMDALVRDGFSEKQARFGLQHIKGKILAEARDTIRLQITGEPFEISSKATAAARGWLTGFHSRLGK